MKTVRCAIYTRKSSDEGLEQDFNSLDAQREACAAYIMSQASEGWKPLPDFYDDGGLSGGTLERPALQRLLDHVREGRIDIIVVYKVDRLTRSLLDFAKLVEAFDDAGTSFVSVTQSFNTTTSMGRLTLNMLLSFAQFEREVTAERIRDKIAASKAKGMWMGGIPPLGYKPDGRSLAIVEDHAALIRDIYARYTRLGNVRLVADSLDSEGITTPRRVNGKGKSYGGCPFTRGQLYAILKNPVYSGDIPHKDKVYPGNHTAIIERGIWEEVQARLADNVRGQRKARETNRSLLAGLLFDSDNNPLIPVHSTKGKRRYRYYVSQAHHHGTAQAGALTMRLPAREVEQVVKQELASLLADPPGLLALCHLAIAPTMLEPIALACEQLCADLKAGNHAKLKTLLARIVVCPDRVELHVSPKGLADLLAIEAAPDAPDAPGEVICKVRTHLARNGRAIRLVQDNGCTAASTGPDPTLARLIVTGQRWWAELARGESDVASIARREKVSPSWMTRVVRLAFLSPPVINAVLTGNIRADIDVKALLAAGAISPRWHEQWAAIMPESQSRSYRSA
ncbi:MAG: recombinase family protein [Caenibius sp.]